MKIRARVRVSASWFQGHSFGKASWSCSRIPTWRIMGRSVDVSCSDRDATQKEADDMQERERRIDNCDMVAQGLSGLVPGRCRIGDAVGAFSCWNIGGLPEPHVPKRVLCSMKKRVSVSPRGHCFKSAVLKRRLFGARLVWSQGRIAHGLGFEPIRRLDALRGNSNRDVGPFPRP